MKGEERAQWLKENRNLWFDRLRLGMLLNEDFAREMCSMVADFARDRPEILKRLYTELKRPRARPVKWTQARYIQLAQEIDARLATGSTMKEILQDVSVSHRVGIEKLEKTHIHKARAIRATVNTKHMVVAKKR